MEVKYNGAWGTVCDDSFDTVDGKVICKMLGFQTAISTFTASPGKMSAANVPQHFLHQHTVILTLTLLPLFCCVSEFALFMVLNETTNNTRAKKAALFT